MKTIYFIVLTLLLSSSSFANCVLKVRVNDVPPQYMVIHGKWTGLAVELMDTLLHEAGCEAAYAKMPWQRALVELEDGRIDAMINVSYSPERANDFYLIWPKTTETTILVTKKDAHYQINSLDDFKSLPQKVIFERGNIFGEEFTIKYNKDDAFRNMFHPLANSNMTDTVIAGRYAGELDLLENVRYGMKHDPKYTELKIHPFVVSERPNFFAFSKKSISTELILKLNEANIRAISKGSYDTVINKWK